MATLTDEAVHRFWAKVEKTASCWLWRGTLLNIGYGQFKVSGKKISAHRLSWEIVNGPIPKDGSYHGTCVCHSCDIRACVNPQHLFLGTVKDNAVDAVRKGRYKEAEAHPNSKLTVPAVIDIKTRLLAGESQSSIAKSHGISQVMVSKIKLGEWWKSVPWPH